MRKGDIIPRAGRTEERGWDFESVEAQEQGPHGTETYTFKTRYVLLPVLLQELRRGHFALTLSPTHKHRIRTWNSENKATQLVGACICLRVQEWNMELAGALKVKSQLLG